MFESRRNVVARYSFWASPHSPHVKIVNWVGKTKRVLDIGCATGYLAEQMKKNGCYVVGVENDPDAANIAKQYCENVIIGDIEHLKKLPYPKEYFDVIVYSDILEHLRRPDLVLMRFKKYLATNGHVIASIPNTAIFSVRLKLLFGKFEYEEKGILDKTHLRFFTLKTAKSLFETSGYEVIEVDYTGPASQMKVFPTLFALQFILIAKKR